MEYSLRHNKLPKSTFYERLRLDDDQLKVSHVCKLEEIDNFWEAFEEEAGTGMARLHENSSRPLDLEWDSSHLEKIRRIHQVDLDYFGYE